MLAARGAEVPLAVQARTLRRQIGVDRARIAAPQGDGARLPEDEATPAAGASQADALTPGDGLDGVDGAPQLRGGAGGPEVGELAEAAQIPGRPAGRSFVVAGKSHGYLRRCGAALTVAGRLRGDAGAVLRSSAAPAVAGGQQTTRTAARHGYQLDDWTQGQEPNAPSEHHACGHRTTNATLARTSTWATPSVKPVPWDREM